MNKKKNRRPFSVSIYVSFFKCQVICYISIIHDYSKTVNIFGNFFLHTIGTNSELLIYVYSTAAHSMVPEIQVSAKRYPSRKSNISKTSRRTNFSFGAQICTNISYLPICIMSLSRHQFRIFLLEKRYPSRNHFFRFSPKRQRAQIFYFAHIYRRPRTNYL